MTDFDWMTEDEEEWSLEDANEKQPRKRPSWLYPLIFFLIIGLSAAGLFSLLNRRADEAEEVVKDDVRRTHELVLEAADKGDVELFTTFLSGADVRWLNLQRDAVSRGRYDEVPWLGYYLEDEPYRVDEVVLSPTLDEAIVTYTRWYESGEQVGEAVPFQHTAVYRRGEDRWLLAPPTADFWGREAIIREGKLTVVYRERDEEEVSQLTDDLVNSLPEICNDLPFGSCPDGWRVRVELSNDLETLLRPTRIDGEIDDLTLSLPTPTLLGVPIDGAGYELMLQSYQERLHREVRGSINRFLAESPELIPPILEAQTIDSDFAQTEYDVPKVDLTFACANGTPGRTEWNAFRYSLDSGAWDVVFQREYTAEDSGLVLPLPGGKDYVVQEYLRGELLTARLLLWHEGQTVMIGEETVNFDNASIAPSISVAQQWDPSGRYLVLRSTSETGNNWFLLDRKACDETGGCAMQSVVGLPVWSPDGEQMLVQEPVIEGLAPTYQSLYRMNVADQSLVEIGEGGTSFWLDERTYGYSRANDDGAGELLLADSADDLARVWVETADLMPLVPEERNWINMSIWNVWVNRANPQMMLLMTTPTGRQNSGPYDFFLVQGDPYSGAKPQVEWLFSDPFPAFGNIDPFSPDGRYLMLIQRGTPIYFVDLETRATVPFDLSLGFVIAWAGDGSYYVQWGEGEEGLTLTSPANGHQMRIVYDFSTCIGFQWDRRES